MHATLADVLADVVQNSIEAGAKNVKARLVEDGTWISAHVEDDGKGMDEATRARCFDPFYTEPGKHDKRKVGLGLPILKQLCEQTGGGVTLESEKGRGTRLAFRLAADNVDVPPMGDLATAVLTLFNYPGAFELVFAHARGGEEYEIARSELAEAVGGFEDAGALGLAREFLVSQEEALPRA